MKNPYRALRRIAANVRRYPMRYMTHLAVSRTRLRVQQGPFAGMRYIERSVGSQLIPKLLGIYERELNECIERACAEAFRLIVDIGAAEGYYAVGLARRNPQARVVAFEMCEDGRRALRELASLNDVACTAPDEVRRKQPSRQEPGLELHGHCDLSLLKHTLAETERSLVICDVEGAEDELLLPGEVPSLSHAFLLVETHDFCRPGVTQRLEQRFSPTHHVRRIWQEERDRSDFPYRSVGTRLLPSFYQAWAVSESRPERMSWLWMEPRTV